MNNHERIECNRRENDFAAQLPSVLMTMAAVGLIVFVNARSPEPSPANAPAARAQSEATRPGSHDRNLGGQPQAALVPVRVQRSSLPL